MPLNGLPLMLESILDILLKDNDLTSWYIKSESDFTQLTVRFRNMAASGGQPLVDCKYKKMTHSQMTRDKARCTMWNSKLNPEASVFTGRPDTNVRETCAEVHTQSCDVPGNQQDSQQYPMVSPASTPTPTHTGDQQYDDTRPKQRAESKSSATLPSDSPTTPTPISPRVTRRQTRLQAAKVMDNQPSPFVGQVDGAYDTVSSPTLPSPKCDRPSCGEKDYLACKELQGNTWQRALYDKMCRLADGGKGEGHG